MEAETLPRKPKAESYTVEAIVEDARRGRIRVPPFQRPLKWDTSDVRAFFDSILKGYPVGSLLLWRRDGGSPDPFLLGPILIDKPETTDVRWLVDGQQRVTSLVAALTKHAPPDPRFDLWFDPDDRRVVARPPEGIDPLWVPLHILLDVVTLGEFLDSWPHKHQDKTRIRALHDAGKRIREYPIPAYLIEADDEAPLREIFRRINLQGKPLSEAEAFDALTITPSGPGLRDLPVQLGQLGWGKPSEETLLWAAHALRGSPLPPPSGPPEGDGWSQTVQRLLAAMQKSIAFLRSDAGIPHLLLLPAQHRLLIVLAAFFERHRDPSPRTRRLLSRWLWRELPDDDRDTDHTSLNQSLVAITRDEEASVQQLLALAPQKEWKIPAPYERDDVPDKSRLALLALATLEPRHLVTGELLSVAELLESGNPAFHPILPLQRGDRMYQHTAANLMIYPHLPQEHLHTRLQMDLRRDLVLRSHAIGREFGTEEFLTSRLETIEKVVDNLVLIRGAFEQDDTPSVQALFSG